MKFLILFLLVTPSAYSQITFKWIGTSTFSLSDSKTTLLFDPAITKIPWYDYLPFRTIKTDSAEVDFWMNQCGLKSINATFVNHAHTDHSIDAPYVVKKFGGKLYGSSSVVNIGLGQGLSNDQVQQIKQGEEWKVGSFTIKPFITPHAPHFFEILIMDGNIDKPLSSPTSAWNYRVGETFSFLITHPKGTILFQAIGRVNQPDPFQNVKADILLLTIANRISSENLIQKRILPSQAKTVIPLHYDNFFSPLRRDGNIDELWGVKTKEFKEKLNQETKNINAVWPRYCESVPIL